MAITNHYSVLSVFLLFILFPSAHAQKSPSEIATEAGRGTVVIRAKRTDASLSSGSGFIADSTGVVVTNFHVVQDAEQIEIRLPNGDVYHVTGTRGVDQDRDLAVLQIPGFDLPVVKLGNSNDVKPGDRIVVIGTALGVLENTVTTGVISGIRQLEGYQLFQMDAAVSPGNSGGPVVNDRGEVIGVTVAKLKEGESLNFAVPVNYARGLLRSQMTEGLSKLTAAGRDHSLFGEVATGLPASWKSLASGTTKAVRQQGDLVYAETVFPAEWSRAGARAYAQYKKQGDEWIGTFRSSVPCIINRYTIYERVKICTFEDQTKLTVVSPTRIEGASFGPPADAKLKCGRCKYDKPAEWLPFTWIPE